MLWSYHIISWNVFFWLCLRSFFRHYASPVGYWFLPNVYTHTHTLCIKAGDGASIPFTNMWKSIAISHTHWCIWEMWACSSLQDRWRVPCEVSSHRSTWLFNHSALHTTVVVTCNGWSLQSTKRGPRKGIWREFGILADECLGEHEYQPTFGCYCFPICNEFV